MEMKENQYPFLFFLLGNSSLHKQNNLKLSFLFSLTAREMKADPPLLVLPFLSRDEPNQKEKEMPKFSSLFPDEKRQP